jgi:hypothetical protein
VPSIDGSTLHNLADKQDKFEHEYSSELVTRIGLFLVFAGFISTVAFELLKMSPKPITGVWEWVGAASLAFSLLLLFAAMVVLLWAALLPGFSVPGKVSDFRNKYDELVTHHKGDVKAADAELREWILDATAEAVDTNSALNQVRARAITVASRLLLVSIVLLVVAMAVLVTPPFLPSNLKPATGYPGKPRLTKL